jgi:hypothetical protein
VVPIAIRFDDQARSAPEKIDLEVAENDVYLRGRQAVPHADFEKEDLQIAPRAIRGRVVDGKPEDIGLANRAAQLFGVRPAAIGLAAPQVGDCSLGGGDWDPESACRRGWCQRPRAVNSDPFSSLAPTIAGDGYVQQAPAG